MFGVKELSAIHGAMYHFERAQQILQEHGFTLGHTRLYLADFDRADEAWSRRASEPLGTIVTGADEVLFTEDIEKSLERTGDLW